MKDNYFFSQPHQPFFVLAFVNAILSMSLFLFSYQDIIYMPVSSSSFHAYGLLYLVFTPAFFGFLFTTFPRFCSTPVIEQKVYMRVFNFYYLGSVLFILGSIISPILSSIGMLVVITGHLLGILILKNIYSQTRMEDTDDMYWILKAMWMGFYSHILFIFAILFYMPVLGLATEIGVYLYLFLLTFSVGQRMIPFFSHVMVVKNKKLLKQIFILLLLHILLEGFKTNSSFITDIAMAYLIGKEILRWKLSFPNSNPLLLVLHIGLIWVPIGLFVGGLSNFITLLSGVNFFFLDIHVLVLGFVFTVLIGFGTRVTLGHSGNQMHADKWTVALLLWTQVVVLLRVLTSFTVAFGWDFMILFNLSAIAWIVMFTAWAIRFLSVLITGKKLTVD